MLTQQGKLLVDCQLLRGVNNFVDPKRGKGGGVGLGTFGVRPFLFMIITRNNYVGGPGPGTQVPFPRAKATIHTQVTHIPTVKTRPFSVRPRELTKVLFSEATKPTNLTDRRHLP